VCRSARAGSAWTVVDVAALAGRQDDVGTRAALGDRIVIVDSCSVSYGFWKMWRWRCLMFISVKEKPFDNRDLLVPSRSTLFD